GNKDFMEWLFRGEVPEMESGAVEIKGIAREAGVRSKIAVYSNVPGVDPVGTFVGGHGTRVNAVVSEVGDQEKIDIVVYAEDISEYITNALSPTKVTKVVLDEANHKARVIVPEDQLSIAIGKSGQNVRLASKLTGYELDMEADKATIVSEPTPEADTAIASRTAATSPVEAPTATPAPAPVAAVSPTPAPAAEGVIETTELPKQPKLKKKSELENSLLESIEQFGE
ncbi:MAG: KH domain-containing protein, partial [Candidatus Saccharimonadales bacterium]